MMSEQEMQKYCSLNELAERGGTVILGGTEDREIPLCELKQAFSLDSKLYNRSIPALTVQGALAVYEQCVAPLVPSCLLLHLGAEDMAMFGADAEHFDGLYRNLIRTIKATNPSCHVVMISLKNPEGKAGIEEMNHHLQKIAESERCEFEDITLRQVWNPQQAKDVLSFAYAMGLGRRAKRQPAMYELIKILFCCGAPCPN